MIEMTIGKIQFFVCSFVFLNFVLVIISENELKKEKSVLPSASELFSNGNKTGQVFNNPYKLAENAKIASLEKHVKMVC